jgi:glycosyltransferase involved in cell wall biosynthesis
MLAPPWISLPPAGYGGIEHVVAILTRELVHRGHRVVLLAAPESQSSAQVREILEQPHPREIGEAQYEVDHVASAFALVEDEGKRDKPFDLVHDHNGFAAMAFADRLTVPVVHTIHGPFSTRTVSFFERHGHKGHLVAISRAQRLSAPPGVCLAGVVPNPIDLREWPLIERKDGYLLWVGRMTREKGPHRAIGAARAARMPLLLAGPVQPGQESFFQSEVEPHVDGVAVTYVGEVGGERKQQLFSHARALLMPIRWPEPFGMVMLEAMACGTPVIAFPEGAALELVTSETGILVENEQQMAAACHRLHEIDPAVCRSRTAERYDVRRVAAAYEQIYMQVASHQRNRPLRNAHVTATQLTARDAQIALDRVQIAAAQ